MNPERWREIEKICNSAFSLSPDERDAFLRQACAGDEDLLQEARSLLAQESGGLLDSPALEAAARELAAEKGSTAFPNPVGQTLQHYRVVEKIGEGGMGVVYRARDTHLNRPVALKMMPDAFFADPERRARFEREARILATLNHPNVASIYGLEQPECGPCLVMELVEGRTLAERLKKGRISLDQALEICVGIARGVEAAHERGIIHRDLKPANVKVTPEGKVKILDFGLGRTLCDRAATTDSSHSPIVTDEMTRPGVVLGTAAYMSPEQAKGKALDKRADVWAFGCILFECLTGKRAFPGQTVSETLAAVIGQEPAWDSLPREMPGKVYDLLKRCLRKDPDQRLHDIADARIEIEESRPDPLQQVRSKPSLHIRLLAAAAVLIVAAGLVFLGRTWYTRSRQSANIPMTAVPLITYDGGVADPTFSPDGNSLAFRWVGQAQDNWDIYIKQIGPGRAIRLTTNAAPDLRPAWSPDGQFVAFLRRVSQGRWEVHLVPAYGGDERRLAEIQSNSFIPTPAWSPDSRWVVTSDSTDYHGGSEQPGGCCVGRLILVSTGTGEKVHVTSPPAGSLGDFDASFSPDGRSLAFVRHLGLNAGDVYRLGLDGDHKPTAEPERLTFENRLVRSPVWTRDGNDILYSAGNFYGGDRVLRRIGIVAGKDSTGYRIIPSSFGENATYVAISPDGRRLIYGRDRSDSNIYKIDLGKIGAARAPEKFIVSTRPEYDPEYSPDSTKIAFTSTRSGSEEIWLCDADGTNPRQLTSMGGPQTCNARWSPDGETIVFDSTRKSGTRDLYLISAEGGSPRRLTAATTGIEARWSRDGKLIIFHSSRTGRNEVYRTAAVGEGDVDRLTKNGGQCAFESSDGRWLYYSRAGALWRMPAQGGEEIQVHPGPLSYQRNFAVVEDGIYFTNRNGSLEFVDFRSGKTTEIIRTGRRSGLELGHSWQMGLTVSPDRRSILCAMWEPNQDDIMLVENFR